jgi:hypothetical protein
MICNHWKSQARGVEAAANPLRITHFTAAAEHSSAKSPSFYSSAFRRSAGADFVLQRAGPNRVRNVCEHFFHESAGIMFRRINFTTGHHRIDPR